MIQMCSFTHDQAKGRHFLASLSHENLVVMARLEAAHKLSQAGLEPGRAAEWLTGTAQAEPVSTVYAIFGYSSTVLGRSAMICAGGVAAVESGPVRVHSPVQTFSSGNRI